MGPLKGVKVIDMTSVLMGPYATQMLGDYGADVIKVESLDGDVTRQIGPTRHAGMGPVFLNTNRSKRSICLDLKKPAGRDAVLRLIKTADVLVYNVRPQAMARLQARLRRGRRKSIRGWSMPACSVSARTGRMRQSPPMTI